MLEALTRLKSGPCAGLESAWPLLRFIITINGRAAAKDRLNVETILSVTWHQALQCSRNSSPENPVCGQRLQLRARQIPRV